MPETKYSIGRDLDETKAMVEGLEHYVRGNEIYGHAGGGGMFSGQMPSLTLGALLMRLRRLQILRDLLTPEQSAELDRLIQANEKTHQEWREHYNAKMEREAVSRLRAMATFFEEVRDSPKVARTSYQPEALRRTIAQELHDAMQAEGLSTVAIEGEMAAVDTRLHRWFDKGDFVWSEILKPAYPEETFWWLYAQPKQAQKP